MEVDIDALIVEVRKRPTLYDLNSKEYHDHKLKRQLWHEVCSELLTPEVWNSLNAKHKMKFETEVVTKWTSLRTCFRRELKVNTCMKDGVLERLKRKKKYIYFDDLLFLLPFTKEYPNADDQLENDQVSDVSKDDDDNSAFKYTMTVAEELPLTIKTEATIEVERLSDQYDLSDEEEILIRDTPPVKKKKVTQQIDSERQSTDNRQTKMRISEIDEDEAFLWSLLPSIKEFSTEEKLRLRIEILTTILNFKKSETNKGC